jgi:hypothetical protein
MNKLYNTKPLRLFTFGCSFTEWDWASWANILAYELDCKFYNFGRRGAGNFYISNLITQADSVYKFNSSDLIIVSWTNISREDRWIEGKSWITPGNIYSQHYYDKKFVNRYANDIHFALRDFSLITLIDNYLSQRCQFHFLSMCDITKRINQWNINSNNDTDSIKELYNTTLNKIKPSFYDVLWNNNLELKFQKNKKEIHINYFDGHPTILEHCTYLEKTFNYCLSNKTKDVVSKTYQEWLNDIKKYFIKFPKINYIWDLPQDLQKNLKNASIIKDSNYELNLTFR